MNKPAAISASLVDVRNIAAHKCVRLEIHVPAEQAPMVMEAFGWPTMVDPVPVALARLENNVQPIKKQQEKRPWHDLKLASQASIYCAKPAFQKFLQSLNYEVRNTDEAADAVRHYCNVDSRKQINLDPVAADAWRELERGFQMWMKAPQHA